MENSDNRLIDTRTLTDRIPGWGADLDPANRPGVPRDAAPGRQAGPIYPDLPQQAARVRVFHTIERPDLTPVFGTSSPPRGLSGRLRTIAYRHSEGRIFRHWMTLLMADRIDVVEGVLSDLAHGKLTNPFSEMGLKSEFRPGGRAHRLGNSTGFRIALGVLGLSAGIWLEKTLSAKRPTSGHRDRIHARDERRDAA